MKRIIRKAADYIYRFALQYQRERVYEKFQFPQTVRFYNVSFEGNITIGDFTYINEGSRIDTGKTSKIVIGRHCAIGRFVHITEKSHDLQRPTTDDQHPVLLETENDTVIGDEVWIGDYVFIKDGVTIGNNAVIGAHSFVNRNVEPFEIVAGVPVKHIRINKGHYKYKMKFL
jgi:maltose O-acetyltransferase